MKRCYICCEWRQWSNAARLVWICHCQLVCVSASSNNRRMEMLMMKKGKKEDRANFIGLGQSFRAHNCPSNRKFIRSFKSLVLIRNHLSLLGGLLTSNKPYTIYTLRWRSATRLFFSSYCPLWTLGIPVVVLQGIWRPHLWFQSHRRRNLFLFGQSLGTIRSEAVAERRQQRRRLNERRYRTKYVPMSDLGPNVWNH